MDKTFTAEELLKIINIEISKELSGELEKYTRDKMIIDLDNDEVEDYEKMTLIECVGLLAYQDHYIRFMVTKELLKETHYTVSEFCKEYNIEMEFAEIIAISKLCQRVTLTENATIKTKINKNKKEVKMFELAILKKVMKIK